MFCNQTSTFQRGCSCSRWLSPLCLVAVGASGALCFVQDPALCCSTSQKRMAAGLASSAARQLLVRSYLSLDIDWRVVLCPFPVPVWHSCLSGCGGSSSTYLLYVRSISLSFQHVLQGEIQYELVLRMAVVVVTVKLRSSFRSRCLATLRSNLVKLVNTLQVLHSLVLSTILHPMALPAPNRSFVVVLGDPRAFCWNDLGAEAACPPSQVQLSLHFVLLAIQPFGFHHASDHLDTLGLCTSQVSFWPSLLQVFCRPSLAFLF